MAFTKGAPAEAPPAVTSRTDRGASCKGTAKAGKGKAKATTSTKGEGKKRSRGCVLQLHEQRQQQKEAFLSDFSAIFDEIGLVRLLFDAFDGTAERLLSEGKRLEAEGSTRQAQIRFKEASDLGNAEAMGFAAFWESFDNAYDSARSLAERGAALGDMTAKAVLGYLQWRSGDNRERGLELMESAVAADIPHAMYLLQQCLDDSARAIELLQQAVDLNFPLALDTLYAGWF